MKIFEKKSKEINDKSKNMGQSNILSKTVTLTVLIASLLASSPSAQSQTKIQPDYNKEYVKHGGQGFESFKQAFKNNYRHEDFEVISAFAETAQMIIDKDFPKMQPYEQTEQKQLDLQQLTEVISPLLQNMVPSESESGKGEEFLTGRLSGNLTEFKDKADISFQQAIELSSFVAAEISPALHLKISELIQAERIKPNKDERMENLAAQITEIKGLIARNSEKLVTIKQQISELQKTGAEKWRIDMLQESIRFIEQTTEEHKNRLTECMSQSASQAGGSYYDKILDRINLSQKYTLDDAIVLLHEGGHAVIGRSYSGNLLGEVPSITSEFIANKYMASQGLGTEYRAVDRVYDMKYYAPYIISLYKVYEEYENTGDLSFETVDSAMKQYGKQSKPPEQYTDSDEQAFADMSKKASYFVGTASALVLQGNIKSKRDLQAVFFVMKNNELTDAQKIEQFGVNKESIIGATNEFVKENRIDLKSEFNTVQMKGKE